MVQSLFKKLSHVRLERCFWLLSVIVFVIVLLTTIRTYNKSEILKRLRIQQIRDVPINVGLQSSINGTSGFPELLPAPRLSSPLLPRALTEDMEQVYMDLLMTLNDLLTRHGVEYIMCDGTLLGSYHFHGFIPWDEDVDITVNVKHLDKLKAVLGAADVREKYGVCEYHSANNTVDEYNPSKGQANEHMWYRWHKAKFYSLKNSVATGMKWRWPFVDIKFYRHDGQYVQYIDSKKLQFRIPSDVFYPLIARPFGTLWLPAPKDTRRYLNIKYKNQKFKCKEGGYDHIKEKVRKKTRAVLCSRLVTYYPFVHHSQTADYHVEELRLGPRLIREIRYKNNLNGTSNINTEEQKNEDLIIR